MASNHSNANFVSAALEQLTVHAGHVFKLKLEQEHAINCLLEGRDVFAVMPTGYGKSAIFQLFVMAMNCKKISLGREPNTTVLVICPLSSIIEDHVKEGTSLGMNCVSMQHFMESSGGDNFQIIFASAEQALDKKFAELLKDKSTDLHNRVDLLVVDESHTVEIWTGKRFVLINYKYTFKFS